jgi:O-acetylserine/cysteine efflux transporter
MPNRHVLLAAAVALAWGVNFVVIDAGLAAFPPLLFAALRFTLVAFPAVLFIRRPAVPLRWILGVGTFMSAGQFGLLFVAMNEGLTAGLASLVLQLQALFTILLSIALLGERPQRAQLVGAGVAFAGLGVIAAGRAHGVPLGALLLCVGAAFSWGIGNICNRRAQAPDALALLVWSSLVPPLPLLGLSFALEGSHRIGAALTGLDAGGLLALLYVVVVSTGFGFGTWTWLMRRHPASRVAPFTLLVPPVGLTAAWVARGERPTLTELAGALIILAGVALITSVLRLPRASRTLDPDVTRNPTAAPALIQDR